MAIGLAFLSFDDAAVVHERLAFRATDALSVSDSYAQVLWPSVYLPLLAVIAIGLGRLTRGSRAAFRMVIAGLGLLATGVGLEIAGVRIDTPLLEKSTIVLEEGVEIAGWVFVATGVAIRLISPPVSLPSSESA